MDPEDDIIAIEELRASIINLRKLFFALEERVEKLEHIHKETLAIIDRTAREFWRDTPYG